MFIPAFTTNAMASDFLSSISPGWVVMFLDSHRMVFTFLSWLDLQGVALAFLISILKSSNYFQTTYTGLQISQASKRHLESSLMSYSNLLSQFGEISFQEFVSGRNDLIWSFTVI